MATATKQHSSTRFKKPHAWKGRPSPPGGTQIERLEWCLEHGFTLSGFALSDSQRESYKQKLARRREEKKRREARRQAARERFEEHAGLVEAWEDFEEAREAVLETERTIEENMTRAEVLDEKREEVADSMAELEAAHLAGEITEAERDEHKERLEGQVEDYQEARQKARTAESLLPRRKAEAEEKAREVNEAIRDAKAETVMELVSAVESALSAYEELETFEEDLQKVGVTIGQSGLKGKIDGKSALPTSLKPSALKSWIEETRDTFESR